MRLPRIRPLLGVAAFGLLTFAPLVSSSPASASGVLTISNATTTAVAGTDVVITTSGGSGTGAITLSVSGCLLYTSDAADE